MDYTTIKLVHQTAVALSVSGFFVRGVLSFAGSPLAFGKVATVLPQVVDTVLLVAAVTLLWLLQLNPLNAPWLLAKLTGLVAYIVLGVVALKPGTPLGVRATAWVAALATVAWMISVAITKSPLGFFAAIG